MNTAFKAINQPLSNKIAVDGKSYLYFGGTAYLGIPKNTDFIKLYIEGINKLGLNNGTSRTNNIQLGIYDEAEKVAAARYGAAAALITSSGYLAAQLTVRALANLGQVSYAPAAHPSLWLNAQPSSSDSFTAWKAETVERINASTEQNWVLISNSMNNLVPEIYDFTFLNDIDASKKLVVIVDDSHGIGVNNGGLSAYSGLPERPNTEYVVVASMAKALGIDAGIVLGSQKIIGQLKKSPVFVGASPPAAAGLYAFTKAGEIYQAAWQKLQQNIDLLAGSLSSTWKYEPGFPAFLTYDQQIEQHFFKQQILISSFPYPNPTSAPINRIVLSSWHEKADIEKLISSINA
ncbi:aminotransferase class I/II [Pedobacter sp. KBW01]|uniref:aminotransferase class I/II-fold pyridoxal phosphate-dependent enzyme n=1 Tax=Pedobacter sp. KBW01 TaxID=2153364 RepID=UPI000F59CE25|nr:aminotransferase class I/II-fold pyridoxal phosphate-dependent enzyme [Pedobacter sp. KBW01]RQO78558.1 aminotransferase class I/II [Pedobacter sp. KBW01]